MFDDVRFLQAVWRAPEADAPRLVYADWLDEKGDPRGEFIRVQCALAKLPSDDARREKLVAREARLIAEHGASWAKPVQGLANHYEFRRGFIEAISLPAEVLVQTGPTLFRRAPIQKLTLTDAGNGLEAWLQLPLLRRVHSLELCGNNLGSTGIRRLAQSPNLRNLAELGLSFNDLAPPAIAALAVASFAPNLTKLDVSLNGRLGTLAFRTLAGAFTALEQLDVSNCQLGPAGFRELFRPDSWPQLKSLELHGNPLGDAGLRLLANRGSACSIGRVIASSGRLNLSACEFTARGLQSLVDWPGLEAVRQLCLSDNPIGDDGFTALTVSTRLNHLAELTARNCDLGDEAALALAGAPLLEKLTHLDLSYNHLGPAGIGAINFSQYRPWRLAPDFAGNAERDI